MKMCVLLHWFQGPSQRWRRLCFFFFLVLLGSAAFEDVAAARMMLGEKWCKRDSEAEKEAGISFVTAKGPNVSSAGREK